MPAKKQEKKNGKSAKRGRRMGGPTVPQTQFSGFCGAFPPRTVRTLRYMENVGLTEPGPTVGAHYIFTPSSLYDPNNTGVGHQFMYFDQLCSASGPYTKYRGLFTAAKVQMVNRTTAPTLVVISIHPSLSTPSGQLQAMERPWSTTFWLQAVGGYMGTVIKTFKIPHAKALGITERHLLSDDSYASIYSSSPQYNFSVCISVWSGSGATAGDVFATVEFDTKAEFFSLANTSSS